MNASIVEYSSEYAKDLIEMSREVANEGTSYIFDETMSEAELLNYWVGEHQKTFVVSLDGKTVAGVFKIIRNHAGRGSHIANASYLIKRSFRSLGLGKRMLEHSLKVAKEQGFKGMQFNLVVSTNAKAIALWESYGFKKVGTAPQAFRTNENQYVDAYVMFLEF